MVKYISFDFSQLRRKFQHEINFNLFENNKNKFYTSKSRNFIRRYFSVISILIIYISRLLRLQCNLTFHETPGRLKM